MTERGQSYEGDRPTAGAQHDRRVALVIGNSAYPNAPLKNPRNDAEAFSAKLKAVHPSFDVTLALDVGRDAMEDALEHFEGKLGGCETALLFFAGHGLQVKGINYLMPVDADIRQEIHLKRRAVSLNEILDIMGRRVRSSSLVFLDACRDNPFSRSLLAGLSDDERGRFLTRSGLAEVRAGAGSFVAFATAPDNVALDGSGANSPFTTALIEHMALPNASINDVMIAVRKDVLKATGGRQEPWDQSSLRERFSFHNVAEPVALVTPPPVSTPGPQFSEAALFEKAALEHWEASKHATDPARLRAFLADYGTSRMGSLARDALQRIATAAWRKVGKRDEAALSRFVEDYAGTTEVAEASATLAALQAARDAAAEKASEKARKAAERGKQRKGDGRNLVIGGVAVIVLFGGLNYLLKSESSGDQQLRVPSWLRSEPVVDKNRATPGEDDEAFAVAEKRGALDGYGTYLGRYPEGRHAKLAKERINWLKRLEAEFARLAASGTRDALATFARSNPAFKSRVDEVLAARDAAETEAKRRGDVEAERQKQAALDAQRQREAEDVRRRERAEAERKAAEAARCPGIRIEVAGNGNICLDPADPAKREFQDCKDGVCGPEMVVVPAGNFMMGSPEGEEGRSSDEGPQRRVTIAKPFAVGKFEVTFAEFDTCVAAGGCGQKPGDGGWGRGKRPVINISWDDAKQYVAWLSKKTGQTYRLLTEAEWEYAARAGTTTPFHFGATISTDQANYDGNYTYGSGKKGEYRQKTIEVGSLDNPNAFGLHDMHGNVWEWVEDCYADSYAKAPSDGSKAPDAIDCSRVLRGGSWSIDPQIIRSADRLWVQPDVRFNVIGFRLARTLNSTP